MAKSPSQLRERIAMTLIRIRGVEEEMDMKLRDLGQLHKHKYDLEQELKKAEMR